MSNICQQVQIVTVVKGPMKHFRTFLKQGEQKLFDAS